MSVSRGEIGRLWTVNRCGGAPLAESHAEIDTYVAVCEYYADWAVELLASIPVAV